mgnify:CR=1 FL=1
MAIFNKKNSTDWEEKYQRLEEKYSILYDKYREAEKEIKELKQRIKNTGYLEPKTRQISSEDILYIKTLKAKEGLSYSKIAKESGWSKATVCRVLNGAYDLSE